jgi:uroporphyrinogen-III synthase
VLKDSRLFPDVITFTSSSTVRNFVELLGGARGALDIARKRLRHTIQLASIGPITSSTLRELGLKADIAAKEYTIPGLVEAIVKNVVRQAIQ